MDDAQRAELFAYASERATRFRASVVDAIARPEQNYGECLTSFSEPMPEHPSDAKAVLTELADRAEPGLMKPAGRRFFGWVIGSSHSAGVAADWLTSAWGQNAGNHHASPAASAAEAVAAGWLLDILDLPRQCSVGFATGATVANFTCLAAARGEVLRRVGWDADAQGLFGAPPISVLIGDDAHTTVFSALQFLGLGHDRVIRVATGSQGGILPHAFEAAMANVQGPAIVILQAGQINTGGFDPFETIIPIAQAAGAWVHADCAFGLWARVVPQLKPMTAGLELADSWATDGHKWLQTPYDCGYAIVRHELAHRRAMTIAASYLPAAADGERDPTHYVPELSRRARGFPAWAIIKTLGRPGIAEMVERNCRVARLMAELLAQEPGIEIGNDVVLNQVIVRFGADETPGRGDLLTQETIKRIQQDGVCFAGGASWRGRQIMRISVCGGETTEED
ncbi:MAG: aspartate aminotransferase family protein, partial [Rhizobiales bacterium]|nr:aspartate aminotransferase family protein [Hyphomicrobiales bacterium]